jgi:two-component system CheB/CheR fusion protein
MTGKRLLSPTTGLLAQPVTTAGSPQGGQIPVVGIGASAGGLDALTKLVSILPADGGMAYVLIQHLEPGHKSVLAELLAEHTSMPVLQVAEGTTIEPDHIYVIPAGKYLSVGAGALHLSKPTAPHGARMPIDFLFKSMAADCGRGAIAIILSGTATDGTVGAKALHDAGGYVIAQNPEESEYDGMPQSVIASGVVDAVLSVKQMPAALSGRIKGQSANATAKPAADSRKALAQIIDLLRKNTPHDFTLYKMGTLQRRIERRMTLASIPANDMARYATALATDPAELKLLATDLLINVTGFFRDPKVYELLSHKTVPDIVLGHIGDGPLRIWIAGCSTGEEAYSLAMIFAEAIAASKRKLELCVFASDVDADAIATAREGSYPDTIAGDVSAARLARFFVKQENGYKVAPDLRAGIVFTVQDLLTDPPFSKLDMVSCRNVLIYLGPEAQAKAIALFHFALRPAGILLLGTSETTGHVEGLFETVAKSERVYRHIGKNKPGALLFSKSAEDGLRVPPRPEQGQFQSMTEVVPRSTCSSLERSQT